MSIYLRSERILIGERIQKERKKKDKTRLELSLLTGISKEDILDIEEGRGCGSFIKGVTHICCALHINPSEVISGTRLGNFLARPENQERFRACLERLVPFSLFSFPYYTEN